MDWNTTESLLHTDAIRHTLRGCVDWNITRCIIYLQPFCHTLRGCVDWNLKSDIWYRKERRSHPSWVCGLKQRMAESTVVSISHTLRGCVDWNLSEDQEIIGMRCHTLRGCVDWNYNRAAVRLPCPVIPFVGVWIETTYHNHIAFALASHPSWVCGLKPLVVLPPETKRMSHPSWVCGLKLSLNDCQQVALIVTPFVGVWIETSKWKKPSVSISGHTLRGCVDWTPSCSNENAVLRRHTLRGCVDWNLSRSQYLACNACHTLRGCVEWNRKQILFSEPTWKVIFTKTCHWLSISYKDKKYDSGLF